MSLLVSFSAIFRRFEAGPKWVPEQSKLINGGSHGMADSRCK
jgi:hypothetical protein